LKTRSAILIKAALPIILGIFIIGCQSPEKKAERLAKHHCASCHAFPDPKLLAKHTWENHVLPQMKFRMGLDYFAISKLPDRDHEAIFRSLPRASMISEEEWEQIKKYYLTHAPDSLIIPDNTISNTALPFDVSAIKLPFDNMSAITLIEADPLSQKLYLGTRSSDLFQLSYSFNIEDSIHLDSPPSSLIKTEQNEFVVLLMGIMDPNDQTKGKLSALNFEEHKFTSILDSLKRPVHVASGDMNNDNKTDFVVSQFGNYTGKLSVFQLQAPNVFQKHTLQYLPGARKVIVKDFNKDGLLDILALMSQGDERIILFLNQGNFRFRPNILLRFPPVFGSSYFDIADFNNDGYFDILYSNGDNADYSTVLKSYHGVRIFLNDGKNRFTEDWFYPMHGASQAMTYDFDEDGDMDIAAISFFPDFERTPEQAFIYFENTPSGFVPSITYQANSGRWLVMKLVDINNDNKMDIVIGALNFPTNVPPALVKKWQAENISLLVLKNIN